MGFDLDLRYIRMPRRDTDVTQEVPGATPAEARTEAAIPVSPGAFSVRSGFCALQTPLVQAHRDAMALAAPSAPVDGRARPCRRRRMRHLRHRRVVEQLQPRDPKLLVIVISGQLRR